jgi:hypothetical protein
MIKATLLFKGDTLDTKKIRRELFEVPSYVDWESFEAVDDEEPTNRHENVTRVEVIDHRDQTNTFGGAFVAWNCKVEEAIQDDGRTLKLFVTTPEITLDPYEAMMEAWGELNEIVKDYYQESHKETQISLKRFLDL